MNSISKLASLSFRYSTPGKLVNTSFTTIPQMRMGDFIVFQLRHFLGANDEWGAVTNETSHTVLYEK